MDTVLTAIVILLKIALVLPALVTFLSALAALLWLLWLFGRLLSIANPDATRR